MRVLILGSGGREHAFAWKVANTPRVSAVFVAPGNAGTALEPGVTNVDIAADDVPKLIEFAKREKIDLTIVGPEAPLVIGVTDAFEAAGCAASVPASSPRASKARRRSPRNSCVVTRSRRRRTPLHQSELRSRVGARSACAARCESRRPGRGQGRDHLRHAGRSDRQHAGHVRRTVRRRRQHCRHRRILEGEEASFIAIVSGKHILPLATSQDHKRRDDGDQGPNTGGMGAYSPAPVVDR